MKRWLCVLLGISLVTGIVFGGCSAPAPAVSPAPTAASSSTPAQSATTSVPQPASSPTSAQAPAKPITLTVSTQSAATAWNSSNALVPLLKQIEQETKGQVKFEIYYSQTLAKQADAWQAVRSGIAGMAHITFSTYPGLTPLSEVMSLPFMPFQSATQASGIFSKIIEKFPTVRDEFKSVHLLFAHTATPAFLVTSKKQVKVMEDLKGLRISLPAGGGLDALKLMGASPMALPSTDQYMNLQKGVIDGCSGNWDSITGFKVYELVKYYSYVPLTAARYCLIMNEDKWNSLPKDVQGVFNSKSGTWGSEFYGYSMFDSLTDIAKPQIIKEGFPVIEYTLTPEEVQRWITASKPVWDSWLKQNNAHPEAQEILNTVVDLAKTYKPTAYVPK
jgi:TRAP-type transport system periplasmic protein